MDIHPPHEEMFLVSEIPSQVDSTETISPNSQTDSPCTRHETTVNYDSIHVACGEKIVSFKDADLGSSSVSLTSLKKINVVDLTPKEMATRAVFLYPDLDKSAVRALRVEERVLELKVLNLDINKKSVALDLKKSQNEMKKRLRKYRDRQRDIFRVKTTTQPQNQSLDEFLTSNIKNKTFTRNSLRPSTCPAKINRTRPSTSNAVLSAIDKEIEVDPSFFTDQRKSKIDLRPSTAREFNGDKNAIRKSSHLGRLGAPEVQIRYFDEDELQDRGTFYTQLVEWRKRQEEDKAKSLDYKVGVFCEQDENEINQRIKRNSCLRQNTHSAIDFLRKTDLGCRYSGVPFQSTSRPNSSNGIFSDKHVDNKKENKEKTEGNRDNDISLQ